MSCNSHRRKFLQHLCQSEQAITSRLGRGDPAVAATVLEQVYRRTIPSRADAKSAAPKAARSTTALFLEFQQRGISFPTHARPKEGQPVPLPSDPQTLCKYAAVYEALQACRKNLPLSRLAERLVKVYPDAASIIPTRLPQPEANVAKATTTSLTPNKSAAAPTITPPARPTHWQPFQNGEKPAYARSSKLQPGNEVFNQAVLSCPAELLVVRPSQRSQAADTDGVLIPLEEHSFEVSRYNRVGNLSCAAHTEGDVWKLMLENPGQYIEEHRGDEDFVHHSYFSAQDNLWHFTRTGTQESYDVTMNAEERHYFSQELDRFPSEITSWQETAYYGENDTGDRPGLLVCEDKPESKLDADEEAEDYYESDEEDEEELEAGGTQDDLGRFALDKGSPRNPFDQGGFNRLYGGFIISAGPTYTADLTTFNIGNFSRSKSTDEQASAQAGMEGIVKENTGAATEWSAAPDFGPDSTQLKMRDLMTKIEHYDHRQLQGSLHTTLGEIAEVNSELRRMAQAQPGAKEQAQELSATTLSKPNGSLKYAFAGADYWHEIAWDEAGVQLKECRSSLSSPAPNHPPASSASTSTTDQTNANALTPQVQAAVHEQILIDWPTWNILARRVQAVETRLQAEAGNQNRSGL